LNFFKCFDFRICWITHMVIMIFIVIIILHVIIIWESTKYVLIISNLFLLMFWFEKVGSRSYTSQYINPRRSSNSSFGDTSKENLRIIKVCIDHLK
jgi:hypothetical protein